MNCSVVRVDGQKGYDFSLPDSDNSKGGREPEIIVKGSSERQAEGVKGTAQRETETRSERRLQRYAALVGDGSGVFELDSDALIVAVTDELLALTGRSRSDLEGDHATALCTEGDRGIIESRILAPLANGREQVGPAEIGLRRRDGATVRCEMRATSVGTDGPSGHAIGVLRPTGPREPGDSRETTAKYEMLVKAAPDAILIADAETGRIRDANEAAEALFGKSREEILGMHQSTLHPEEDRARYRELFENHGDRGGFFDEERDLYVVHDEGHRIPVNISAAVVEYDDERVIQGIFRDVTDRNERESELHREREAISRILETSPVGIGVITADGKVTRANTRAIEILDLSEKSELTDCEAVGHRLVDARGDSIPSEELPPARVFATGEPVYADELAIERGDGERIWLSVSAAPIEDADGEITRVVVVGEDITERKEHQRTVAAQRDQLRTLDQINSVIRSINQTLVRASTRAEIESAVCKRFADSKLYRGALIGRLTTSEDGFVPGTAAGIDHDYLERVGRADSDEMDDGPVATAIETDELQVVQDVSADPSFPESVREAALEHGFRSVAYIPLSYGGTVYEALVVYAPRVDAFGEREISVLAELGETIGYAMNAIERREALMADSVARCEFRFDDLPDRVSDGTLEDDSRIVVDRTVATNDGSFLQYVSVEGLSEEAFRSFVEQFGETEHVRSVNQHDGRSMYEVKLAEPPFISTFVTYGGRVRTITIESGEIHVVAELPHSADIREVMARIEEEFSGSTLVSQRTVSRPESTAPEVHSTVEDGLTEKQRRALEAAYAAGYYGWPRETTGEELAASMGISPPTFHQHLRKAQQGLLKSIFPPDSD